jgi:hypothetical protein
MRAFIVMATLLGIAGAAHAEDGIDKSNYPAAVVDRPMILPRLMLQPVFEIGPSNTNSTDGVGGGAGGSLGFGIDVGLTRRLQAGAYLAFPFYPVGNFGDFVGNLQVNLLPQALNLRFDLGTERITSTMDNGYVYDSFVFGVGLPTKIKLHPMLAFISGSTSARGFGVPMLMVQGRGGQWGGLPGVVTESNDIIALQAFNPPGDNSTVVVGSFFLPVGVLFQPHPIVSLSARTGYRLQFNSQSAGSVTVTQVRHFIPLGFDLAFNIAHRFDVGFTATIAGFVSGKQSQAGPGVPNQNDTISGNYADNQRYDFWVAARF